MLNYQTETQAVDLARIAQPAALYQAWRKVRANRGAAGVDAVSLELFERNLAANLQELSRNLLAATYEPLPARYVTIAKDNGKERELAILTVRDRVAQRAVLDALDPLFEPTFLDCSYAFRPGRNVAMAIQRLLMARAHGFVWTVRADVADFFPSLDGRLLLREIAAQVPDARVLRLLEQWLRAAATPETDVAPTAGPSWWERGQNLLAGAQVALREQMDGALDKFVNERLGVTGHSANGLWDDDDTAADDDADLAAVPTPDTERRDTRRAAVRHLAEAGLTLALAERQKLVRLLPLPVLGGVGAALAAAYFAPSVVRKLRASQTPEPHFGALQGAPVSPLLSNIYLHPFDQAMTNGGHRLLRYCDDFAIACQDQREAETALQQAAQVLAERRLRLNEAKTRLIAPGEAFDFLGYEFAANGRVVPPPSVPQALARQLVSLSQRSARWLRRKQ